MCNIGYPGFKSQRFRLPMIDVILLEVTTPCVGFSGSSVVKNPPANPGYTWGSIPGSGRFPGEGNGYPLQYSCLKNSMDSGTWWATVHGVAKSQMQLSD